MAGRYNTWLRNKLADRIEGHGEYCADRRARFPIEWNVPFYASIDDEDDAIALMVKHGHVENEADYNLRLPDSAWSDSFGQDAWEHAQKCLVADLTSAEGLSMWSPNTAKKYGFDYKGAGADRPFRTMLENYGRGGKHVVLAAFEGVTLQGASASALAELIRGRAQNSWGGSYYSNKWCRQLMGMLDEWDEAFTRENASRCGQRYMAGFIAQQLGFFDWERTVATEYEHRGVLITFEEKTWKFGAIIDEVMVWATSLPAIRKKIDAAKAEHKGHAALVPAIPMPGAS